ncbi:MAG: hypothetical protein SCJ94_07765, partial [Bacillota bacterium]|nr:hypothetical protein [Bacillota bacterium]
PDDAELMVLRLEEEGFSVDWNRVQTEETFLESLEDKPDFILADWSLPNWDRRFSRYRYWPGYGTADY